jgi:hypothetical protein
VAIRDFAEDHVATSSRPVPEKPPTKADGKAPKRGWKKRR